MGFGGGGGGGGGEVVSVVCNCDISCVSSLICLPARNSTLHSDAAQRRNNVVSTSLQRNNVTATL